MPRLCGIAILKAWLERSRWVVVGLFVHVWAVAKT
jgi:hypothetical protein